jgi:hypothetical protein
MAAPEWGCPELPLGFFQHKQLLALRSLLQQQKAARRLQREGGQDPDYGRKACDLCTKKQDTLIRCQIDASLEWHMVGG